MKNFDLTRFVNFGKYDFTINKAFYRNATLATVFGSIGIATAGFLLRWNMLENARSIAQHLDDDPDRFDLFGSANPEIVTTTVAFLVGFCTIMICMFAGYTFHNLRNKQGRIMELTIPATNLERWTWHTLTSVFGGLAVCIFSVVCADAVNAILNLAVYGTDVMSSITAEFFRVILLIPNGDMNTAYSFNATYYALESQGMVWSVRYMIACSVYLTLCIYIFGNSVKYKYNIILTYVATQVISTIIMLIGIMIAMYISRHPEYDWHPTEEEAESFGKAVYYFITTLFLVLGSTLLWGSYRLYSKAQITSRINR